MGYQIPPMPTKLNIKVVCAYCGTPLKNIFVSCSNCGATDAKVVSGKYVDERRAYAIANVHAQPQ